MDDLFLIAFFISIAVWIIWMVKPTILNKDSIINRESISLRMLVISSALLIGFGLSFDGGDSTVSDNTEAVELSATETPKMVTQAVVEELVEPEKTFNMTAAQFKMRFNKISKLTKNKFHIDSIEIEDGEINNTATVTLNKNCVLILSFNKDNILNDVASISTGDGSLVSGANTLKIAQVIFRTFNTTLTPLEANKAAYALWSESVKMMDNADMDSPVKVVDGVKYFASASGVIGVWFGASPI